MPILAPSFQKLDSCQPAQPFAARAAVSGLHGCLRRPYACGAPSTSRLNDALRASSVRSISGELACPVLPKIPRCFSSRRAMRSRPTALMTCRRVTVTTDMPRYESAFLLSESRDALASRMEHVAVVLHGDASVGPKQVAGEERAARHRPRIPAQVDAMVEEGERKPVTADCARRAEQRDHGALHGGCGTVRDKRQRPPGPFDPAHAPAAFCRGEKLLASGERVAAAEPLGVARVERVSPAQLESEQREPSDVEQGGHLDEAERRRGDVRGRIERGERVRGGGAGARRGTQAAWTGCGRPPGERRCAPGARAREIVRGRGRRGRLRPRTFRSERRGRPRSARRGLRRCGRAGALTPGPSAWCASRRGRSRIRRRRHPWNGSLAASTAGCRRQCRAAPGQRAVPSDGCAG